MSYAKICLHLLAALAMAATPSGASADPPTITLTMDDLPAQPINGLVHPQGVQFGFTVNGVAHVDARYAAGGPGDLTFVQDPSIEGATTGVLSLAFTVPTPVLQFGVARNVMAAVPNGVSVELFNAANLSLGVTALALSRQPTFAEAQFTYSGEPVKRATLNFTSAPAGPGGQRFALDNLTFSTVPEPAATMLAACAIAGVYATRRHARRSTFRRDASP